MLKITVDTKEFDRVFKEYMKYTSRDFAEACNQHAYYIARDAVQATEAAPKDRVYKDLMQPATKVKRAGEGAPIAAILVNKYEKAHGRKGLSGARMAKAVERFIKKRQRTTNFLKAGWVPAVKKLEKLVPRKGGASLGGVKAKGKPKGDATPATPGTSPISYIWNEIIGEPNVGRVHGMLLKGAQEAIRMETQSMRDYIVKKQKTLIKQLWGS